MERFVYYSKPKLIASLAPLFLIAGALIWLGLKSGVVMLLAASWVLVVLALLLKLRPYDKPVLALSSSEVSFGPGLTNRISLSDIKFAFSGGSSSHAWFGNVSVLLEMNSRVSVGQRYYDRKTIQLFCIDTSPEAIAERINSLIPKTGRDDGSQETPPK